MSDSQIKHSFARFCLKIIYKLQQFFGDLDWSVSGYCRILTAATSPLYTVVAEKVYVKRVVCHNSQHS